MRSETNEADLRGIQLYHVPHHSFCDAVTPALSSSANAPKQFSGVDLGRMNPLVQDQFDPFGHWNSSNVTTFADEIHDGPMIFSLLQVSEI